jgi:hypothetical protein
MKQLPFIITALLLVVLGFYTFQLKKKLTYVQKEASDNNAQVSSQCETQLSELKKEAEMQRAIAEQNLVLAMRNEQEAFRYKKESEENKQRAEQCQRQAMEAQKSANRLMQLAEQNAKLAHDKTLQLEQQLKEKN